MSATRSQYSYRRAPNDPLLVREPRGPPSERRRKISASGTPRKPPKVKLTVSRGSGKTMAQEKKEFEERMAERYGKGSGREGGDGGDVEASVESQVVTGRSVPQVDPFSDPVSSPVTLSGNGGINNGASTVEWETAYKTKSLPIAKQSKTTEPGSNSSLSNSSCYNNLHQVDIVPAVPSPPHSTTCTRTPRSLSRSASLDALFVETFETSTLPLQHGILPSARYDSPRPFPMTVGKLRQDLSEQVKGPPIHLGSLVTEESASTELASGDDSDVPIKKSKAYLKLRGGGAQVVRNVRQQTIARKRSLREEDIILRELIDLASSPLEHGPCRDRERIYQKDLSNINSADYTYPLDLEKKNSRMRVPDFEQIDTKEELEERIQEAKMIEETLSSASSTLFISAANPLYSHQHFDPTDTASSLLSPPPASPPSQLIANVLEEAAKTINTVISSVVRQCPVTKASDMTEMTMAEARWMQLCDVGKEQFMQACRKQDPFIAQHREVQAMGQKHALTSSDVEMEDRVVKKLKKNVRTIQSSDSGSI